MRLRAEQVEAHLANALARSKPDLAPVWLIHGDETLLVLESADAVRAAARKRGHGEREVHYAERAFDWSRFLQSAASQSLFGERKIVELRFSSGRPSAAAAAALEPYCANPNPEVVLLATMPRPEGSGWWTAGWYAAFDRAGVVVEAQPVTRAQLPQWLAARLARQKQRASAESLALMADRVEGNLLAAQQEILKLALLAPEGELSAAQIAAAVSSVARYDFEALAEALYAGDAAYYLRALEGLRGEGESAAGLAWRLGEELVALHRIRLQMAGGQPLEGLFAAHRIWRSAQPRCEKALRRLSPARLHAAALHVARIERASKGAGRGSDCGDPWDELATLGLELLHGVEAGKAAQRGG
ncbi:MAG TPA: DNA polymerase III subunit delta [Burkholderiales bacterium]|nr:DNA polymerase III subunit delta [Burkholderiales bacterium]